MGSNASVPIGGNKSKGSHNQNNSPISWVSNQTQENHTHFNGVKGENAMLGVAVAALAGVAAGAMLTKLASTPASHPQPPPRMPVPRQTPQVEDWERDPPRLTAPDRTAEVIWDRFEDADDEQVEELEEEQVLR
ncbi:hypothetical protein AA313_de0200057 [Arthrobotrys entomopaga]|nr:hypothetical protein AA313_de0200057 [Arthrobotrys entomopaga]